MYKQGRQIPKISALCKINLTSTRTKKIFSASCSDHILCMPLSVSQCVMLVILMSKNGLMVFLNDDCISLSVTVHYS